MRLEVLHNNEVLRQFHHNQDVFLEAKKEGEYELRLTNDHNKRRLAVVSVDGINVIDGTDAGFDGPGYVLQPFQSLLVKGFLRSNKECARFVFASSEGSYANQTGRGKKNVGVIGVAVFDEKEDPFRFVPPVVERLIPVPVPYPHPWRRPWWDQHPWEPLPHITCNTGLGEPDSAMDTLAYRGSEPATATFGSTTGGVTKGLPKGVQQSSSARSGRQSSAASGASEVHQERPAAKRSIRSAAPKEEEITMRSARRINKDTVPTADSYIPDVGTAYGKAETFHTNSVQFVRASSAPVLVLALRYAVKEKLRQWGVPVDTAVPPSAPSAFPVSQGFAPPPPGWVR